MTEVRKSGPKTLLRDRDVAELFDVSERTIRTWRAKGALPVVRTPSGRPRTPYQAVHKPARYEEQE